MALFDINKIKESVGRSAGEIKKSISEAARLSFRRASYYVLPEMERSFEG